MWSPDRNGFWWADMGPVEGRVLGPLKNRTEALQAERGWVAGTGRLRISSAMVPQLRQSNEQRGVCHRYLVHRLVPPNCTFERRADTRTESTVHQRLPQDSTKSAFILRAFSGPTALNIA